MVDYVASSRCVKVQQCHMICSVLCFFLYSLFSHGSTCNQATHLGDMRLQQATRLVITEGVLAHSPEAIPVSQPVDVLTFSSLRVDVSSFSSGSVDILVSMSAPLAVGALTCGSLWVDVSSSSSGSVDTWFVYGSKSAPQSKMCDTLRAVYCVSGECSTVFT